jgi:hypothetical protein
MDELGTLFSLSNLPGHGLLLSYCDFLLANRHLLVAGGRRHRAVARNSLLLAFRRDLRTGIGWDLIFIIIYLVLSSDWERVRLP